MFGSGGSLLQKGTALDNAQCFECDSRALHKCIVGQIFQMVLLLMFPFISLASASCISTPQLFSFSRRS